MKGYLDYTIILKGDVTGDGLVNLSDISRLFNYYKGKTSLANNYLQAGLVVGGSKISLADVSKLYNYYKDKVSSLD